MRRGSRFVLIVAIATTIATSAPTQDFRTASGNVTAPVDTVVHVTVRFSLAVAQESDTQQIEFTGTAHVVPDDPTVEPFDADHELSVHCGDMHDCELGFSIEGAEGGQAFATITATAIGGAASCGGNLHFSDSAKIEVIVE